MKTNANTCTRSEAFVRSYVDGELAASDREGYEQHIGICSRCQAITRFEARFKAAVRGHLPRRQVPAVLERRILEAVASTPIAPARWPWVIYPRMFPAVAALGVLVVVGGMATQPTPRPRVLDQARRFHQAELPMDVAKTDCGFIASWFRGRLDFPVQAPRMPVQITCVGGRLVNVRDRPAAYLAYQDQRGHRVSVLVVDPESESGRIDDEPLHRVVNGRDIFYRRAPGLSLAAYQEGGLEYVVASDLDVNSLTQLVGSFTQ